MDISNVFDFSSDPQLVSMLSACSAASAAYLYCARNPPSRIGCMGYLSLKLRRVAPGTSVNNKADVKNVLLF